jgi:hypothetical protein
MKHWDLAETLADSKRDASFVVGNDVWQLQVFGITQVGRDLFIQVVLRGPRFCTATVRARATSSARATAVQLLEAIGEWLTCADLRDHVYLECAEAREQAS